MIGVPWNVPNPPGFVIVNVPPWTSSGISFFVRARLGQVGDRTRDAEQVEVLRVPDHRDDQALAVLERDGDAEVDERPRDDLLAADLAVDPRPVAQRLDGGLGDEREVGRVDAVGATGTPSSAARAPRRRATCRPRSRSSRAPRCRASGACARRRRGASRSSAPRPRRPAALRRLGCLGGRGCGAGGGGAGGAAEPADAGGAGLPAAATRRRARQARSAGGGAGSVTSTRRAGAGAAARPRRRTR